MRPERQIVVISKDLELDIRYCLHLSESQARQVLAAVPGKDISLGNEGWWLVVRESTVSVRQGSNPTLLDRQDVVEKIEEALIEGEDETD